jgi:archaellum component FlaC
MLKPYVLVLIVIIAVLAFALVLVAADNELAKAQLAETKKESASAEAELKSQIELLTRQVNQKDAEISNLTVSLDQKEMQLSSVSERLDETEHELNQTKTELASKETRLEEAEEHFQELKDEIKEVESSLDETLQWLQDNSHMSAQTEYFIEYSDRKCVDGNDLNLACVAMFMDMHLDFVYVDEPNDKLNSIDEMIAKGGGDCEDFSLFLKALLNDYQANANLLTWEEGTGKFIIHSTSTKQWFYEDAEPLNLGKLKNYYPAVFCYVTSYTTYRLEGHCIVALPVKEITSRAELHYLDGAETFEPQTGEYMGTIGKEFKFCEQDCGTVPGDSIIVITDSDIYQMIDGRWESIEEQKEKLDELKQSLP